MRPGDLSIPERRSKFTVTEVHELASIGARSPAIDRSRRRRSRGQPFPQQPAPGNAPLRVARPGSRAAFAGPRNGAAHERQAVEFWPGPNLEGQQLAGRQSDVRAPFCPPAPQGGGPSPGKTDDGRIAGGPRAGPRPVARRGCRVAPGCAVVDSCGAVSAGGRDPVEAGVDSLCAALLSVAPPRRPQAGAYGADAGLDAIARHLGNAGGCISGRRPSPGSTLGLRQPATRTGRCFAAFEGAAASKAIQGAGCQSTPSAESSAAGRPRPASRAGYPVTVSELVARNRWQPAGPRLSRCRRRAGGSHRRCRAIMHGASWQHGAPSLASATVADKASVSGVRRYSWSGVPGAVEQGDRLWPTTSP